MGGGAWAKNKKICAQGKITRKKIHARQLILKNIHAMAWKKFTYGIWFREKFPTAQKFPSPPLPASHNFSNGCPLDPCTNMVEVKVQITASLKLSFCNCTSCVFCCDVISFIAQFKYMKFIYSTFHNASHLILWEVCESIWAWSQSEIFGLN